MSGLLTGADICGQLEGRELGDELFIPENALRDGEDIFLCGMTLPELAERLSVRVRISKCDGYEFVRDLLGQE